MCEMEAVEVRTFPPDVRCARNLAQYDVILHRGFHVSARALYVQVSVTLLVAASAS